MTGEQAPLRVWTLNMNGLLNTLEIARERTVAGKSLGVFWAVIDRCAWPEYAGRRHAATGRDGPDDDHGISKQAGERLCEHIRQVWC